MKKWMYNVLICVFAGIFLVSAGFLVKYFRESRQQQSQFDELAGLLEQAQPKHEELLDATQQGSVSDETVAEDPYAGMVQVEDPKTGELIWILAEYAELYRLNPDIVGWIQIENTKINYPVMQKSDYTDYYLKRDFYGKYSSHGCIYVREVCDVNAPSDNITLYGHNMKDGSMFAALMKYKKQSFWQEHPTIIFNTLTEHHTYEVMAAFYTTATESKGFQYHLFVDAADEAEFDEFVQKCRKLSVYDTGVTASYGDKLITLSTCEYSQTNGRFVVVAKRVS